MPCMGAAEPSAAGSSPGYAYFGICVEQLPLTGTTLIEARRCPGDRPGRGADRAACRLLAALPAWSPEESRPDRGAGRGARQARRDRRGPVA
jgi:hypothetical protein